MHKPLLIAAIVLLPLIVASQSWTFSEDGIEYVLELPSATWRAVARVDLHQHREFINGHDEADGYLRLSKIVVTPTTTAADIFQRNEQFELKSLPGYVVCSEGQGQPFKGNLKGEAFSYEYVNRGRQMAGKIYYLQVNNRTFYRLHFTIAREKLPTTVAEIDAIANSFRMK